CMSAANMVVALLCNGSPNSCLSLSFYHAEQEAASLGGLAVSVFVWCKAKDNFFLSNTLTAEAGIFHCQPRLTAVKNVRNGFG
ncbi:MAG: hypothetical protein IJZ74_02850, partial [Clostridia bacterium]|nr:hypothetical protein [Clostridia bacterium]